MAYTFVSASAIPFYKSIYIYWFVVWISFLFLLSNYWDGCIVSRMYTFISQPSPNEASDICYEALHFCFVMLLFHSYIVLMYSWWSGHKVELLISCLLIWSSSSVSHFDASLLRVLCHVTALFFYFLFSCCVWLHLSEVLINLHGNLNIASGIVT